MRRCGSGAPPPTSCQGGGYKGLRVQADTGPKAVSGAGSLGAPASCTGKAGSPVPWPRSLDQRPRPGPSPGAGGVSEGGGLVGKEAVGGGAGTVGRALKALKAGDQVCAPLGQEGAHLSLDGPEMKGVCPPPPPTTKQDVLEGTRAPACSPVPCACLCRLICGTTSPNPASQSEAEECRLCYQRKRSFSGSKKPEVMHSHSRFYHPPIPHLQEPFCRAAQLYIT